MKNENSNRMKIRTRKIHNIILCEQESPTMSYFKQLFAFQFSKVLTFLLIRKFAKKS